MVDPSWNDEANASPDYKKVLLDIYCPEQVVINTIPNDRGVQNVEKTFRGLACNSQKATKDYYLKSNSGLEKIWRVNDIGISKCYWGFHYVKNDGN